MTKQRASTLDDSHKPTSPHLNDLIFEAAQVLKKADPKRYATVIRWMLAKEKSERDAAKPVRKRKQTLFDRRGHRIELYAGDVKRMSE